MKLKYNAGDDVFVITLKDEALSYGEEVSDNIIAHYSAKDELIEIEILGASSFLKKESKITVPEKAEV